MTEWRLGEQSAEEKILGCKGKMRRRRVKISVLQGGVRYDNLLPAVSAMWSVRDEWWPL